MEYARYKTSNRAPVKTDFQSRELFLQPCLDQSHRENYLIEKLFATKEKNTLFIKNEAGFRAKADTISSHAADSLIDEIDYIFESAKDEALNVIENAKRKAQDCLWKAMNQETLSGSKQNYQSDSSSVRGNVSDINVANSPRQERKKSTSVKKMIEMIEHQNFLSISEEDKTNESETEQDEIASDNKEDAVEAIIKENLEQNKIYISDCVKTTDLIAFYDLFTTAQTKELRSIYKRSPNEATAKAFEEISLMHDKPEKYRRLLSALKDTGYPKVVQILEGILIPVGTRHRQTIRNCAKHIFQRLNTTEILPYLYSKGIISNDDCQQVKKTERTESTGIAALELLDLLPNRNERWYRYFIESLVESGHGNLANIIEENTKEASVARQNRNQLGYRSESSKELRTNNENAVFSIGMSQKEAASPSPSFSEQSCVLVTRRQTDESDVSDTENTVNF